jgi:hypothetical protein
VIALFSDVSETCSKAGVVSGGETPFVDGERKNPLARRQGSLKICGQAEKTV